jgi:hypothetical protein
MVKANSDKAYSNLLGQRTAVRKRIAFLAAALTLVGAAAAWSQPPQVHVPVPEGWTAVDQEYRYGRDNLWEYINGAADLFLEYRFRELIVLDLEKGDQAVSVSVYDMGSRLDAFGVYEVEKPDGSPGLEGIGVAAILQPPYRGLLLKDRFYVKIEVGAGDLEEEALEGLLRSIAAGLPGYDELPPAVEALPAEGRKEGTVAFTGSSFLGLNDLGNCLHAEYEIDGQSMTLFVMSSTPRFKSNERGKWQSDDGADGKMIYWRKIPYQGPVVLMGDDEQLLGVVGLDDVGAARKLLQKVGKE